MTRSKNLTGAVKAFGAAFAALCSVSAAHAQAAAPDAALIERGAYLAKAGDCVAVRAADVVKLRRASVAAR